MERARDVHKFCLRTQTVESKIRAHYSGISIHNFLRMQTECGECAPSHCHSHKNVLTVYSISVIKLKSKIVHYAEKVPGYKRFLLRPEIFILIFAK